MTDPIHSLNAALEGRYRIDRELGQGGMATVYLADDLRHERKVALKVLKPELAAVVGAERFLAEIKTTANLTHPNILPLHDSGEAEGNLFYVMPFVEGETLRDRLDREHQLPVDDAVRIASDVAEALEYAHGHGVIHRDIKPANILIQAGRPLIADFGIALAVGDGSGRLTETGLSLGTPHYMSPEQAAGDRDVGPATDIYALGCVLYEMLVGEPPFTGSTPQAILAKILTQDAASVRTERPTVPSNVSEVVATATRRVPADRFASAGAMVSALADSTYAATDIAELTPTRRVTSLGGGAVALLVLVIIAALGIPGSPLYVLDWRTTSGTPLLATGDSGDQLVSAETRPPLILVLPLNDQTGRPGFASLGNRLADEIRRSLVRHSTAELVPRVETDRALRENGTNVAVLSALTGATHAVTGSFYESADSLSVTLEVLSDGGESIRVLDEIRGHPSSLGRLTTAIADQAAAAVMDLTFTDGFEFRFWSLSKSPQATLLYQRASAAFNEGRTDEASDLLIQAVSVEPGWPRLYWVLRQSLRNGGRSDEWPKFEAKFDSLRSRLSRDEQLFIVWQRADRPAERLEASRTRFDLTDGASITGFMLATAALALNRLPLAQFALERQDFEHPEVRAFPYAWTARVQIYHLLGEFDRELDLAIEAQRRMPDAFLFRATEVRALVGLGRPDDAMSAFRALTEVQTSETRRLWNALHQASMEVRLHGDREMADRAAATLEEWAMAQSDLPRFEVAQTFYHVGNFAEAVPLLEAEVAAREGLAQLPPQALLVICLARLGRVTEADALESEIEYPAGSTDWRRQWLAMAAAGTGDADRALTILVRAFEEGVPYFRVGEDFLHLRPEFELIREDPRFRRLMTPPAN